MGDSDAGKFVEETISGNKVVLFSKTTCPHCVQAKGLLTSLGCKFTSFELDQMHNGSAIQDYLGKTTGARTVPRVFIGGECIGGASDTMKLHEDGRLMNLIG
ncbi:glutaredoxin-2, mitochondrial-like [Hetaerina americana]|uniref:glutaredoxin-2, mitochondrial-like n=1 Tax=Hetaerina americana TaxID=62018 RepID=UPI003A7F29F8